jgi:hypothetical protein
MKRMILIVSMISVASGSFAQAKEYSAFIPQGFEILDEGFAKGDLNKDGIEDVALALFHINEKTVDYTSDSVIEVPERILLVLFGDGNGYKLAARSGSMIMCKECGGIFGDPFAGIEIVKNILIVNHYGGSNWRWGYTYRFRYQDGDFYLIGKTSHSFWCIKECESLNDFAGTNYEDINLITGQFERKRISEDCKLLENKKGKMKVLPLVKLSKASID